MNLDPAELKAARLARGISQAELARRSGVHVVLIGRIESTMRANSSTMRALTEALGIVVDVPEVVQ